MTYSEAIQFLYGLHLFGAKFGLENTFQLAALAGNPQEKLRFIHVAGTNGKGSTCAMLESIYRAAGLARRAVHLAAPGFVPRTDSGQPPVDSRRRTWSGWSRNCSALLQQFPEQRAADACLNSSP